MRSHVGDAVLPEVTASYSVCKTINDVHPDVKFFQGTGFQACHCGISRGRFDRKPTDRHLCLSNRRLSALKYGRVGPQHDQVATAFNECLREPCCYVVKSGPRLQIRQAGISELLRLSHCQPLKGCGKDFGLVPEVLVEGGGCQAPRLAILLVSVSK